jgi:hypothetical protein
VEELEANVPQPGSERGAWALAVTLGVLGIAVLALVLSGVVGGSHSDTGVQPPPVIAATPTPSPPVATEASYVLSSPHAGSRAGGARNGSGAGGRARAGDGPSGPAASRVPASARAKAGARVIVGDPTPVQAHRDLAVYQDQTTTHIAEHWMQGFYPIYAVAQRTFGVNWLLLASIHKQESAFSTAPGIYHGLNFANCCGGPMQFNVTNGGSPGGTGSTWELVSNSYRYAARPGAYDHMTAHHPSIYDDFDAIMAAAHLLSADGAAYSLDGTAWNAAYDYYGHDATGVTYADQVLARAIGWSQHGFCINCGVETSLLEAVHAAYGAPVAASLETASAIDARSGPHSGRHKGRRR